MNDCLYPSLAPYLSTLIQTILLVIVSFIAAMFLRDDAVSLGQSSPRPISSEKPIPPAQPGSPPAAQPAPVSVPDEVPLHLRSVVEGIVYVERFEENQVQVTGIVGTGKQRSEEL